MKLLLATLALLAALATTFGACTLLGADPPKNSCKSDMDCFTDQEVCNLDEGVCEPKPDAGP